jgi:hypothetical protein
VRSEVTTRFFTVDGNQLLSYHMKTITLKEVVTFQNSERDFSVLQVNTYQREATKPQKQDPVRCASSSKGNLKELVDILRGFI